MVESSIYNLWNKVNMHFKMLKWCKTIAGISAITILSKHELIKQLTFIYINVSSLKAGQIYSERIPSLNLYLNRHILVDTLSMTH